MAITAIGVLLVAYLGLITLRGFGPGLPVTWSVFGEAFVFAIVLGIINAIVKPVAQLLALPVSILTLGVFALLVNLAMFYLAAAILPTVTLNGGFWLTALAAIIVSLFGGFAGGMSARSERG